MWGTQRKESRITGLPLEWNYEEAIYWNRKECERGWVAELCLGHVRLEMPIQTSVLYPSWGARQVAGYTLVCDSGQRTRLKIQIPGPQPKDDISSQEAG